jgi:hypothetical protein
MTSTRSALSRTPVRLGAYLAAVALVFGAAYAGGSWWGPAADADTDDTATAAHGEAEPQSHDAEAGMRAASGTEAAHETAAVPPGLQVSQDGYTLLPDAVAYPAGRQVPFRFQVTGPDGSPLTAYELTHEKELHLIVVRRDLSGFQHVHPVRDGAGRWSVALDLPAAGTYRVFADFAPGRAGHRAADGGTDDHATPTSITLGTDIAVGGAYAPTALPAPAGTASVDGYDVALTGTPVAGREVELAFTVTRGGVPVTDLQPYLGAFGHLVSLRAGDLAYLHTHPADDAHAGETGGPAVRFATTFPTPGSYRLFLDFRAGDAVRTAAFTVTVPYPAP